MYCRLMHEIKRRRKQEIRNAALEQIRTTLDYAVIKLYHDLLSTFTGMTSVIIILFKIPSRLFRNIWEKSPGRFIKNTPCFATPEGGVF